MSGGIDARPGRAGKETRESLAGYVRRNINVIEDRLPEPSTGPWTATEIGIPPWVAGSWADVGLTRIVSEAASESEANTYETTRVGWRVLEEAHECRGGPRLPCGHYGLRNPRETDGVTCMYEDCMMVFDPEEVTE